MAAMYGQAQPVYAGQPQQVVMMNPPQQQVMMVQQIQPLKQWKVPICDACCEAPGDCCETMCCPLCVVYSQRKRLLAFTGEPYSCCARDSLPRANCCDPPIFPPLRPPPATWPPQEGTAAHHMLTDFQPELCCEVFCCLGLAMLSTRWLMQFKFKILNGDCDACLLCAGCSAQPLLYADGAGGAGGAGGCCFACATTQVTLQQREEERLRMSGPQVLLLAPQQQVMGSAVAMVPMQGPASPSAAPHQYQQPYAQQNQQQQQQAYAQPQQQQYQQYPQQQQFATPPQQPYQPQQNYAVSQPQHFNGQPQYVNQQPGAAYGQPQQQYASPPPYAPQQQQMTR